MYFAFRSLASSAYEMKKHWDELVAAKQAERDLQRLEEEMMMHTEEFDSSNTVSGSTTPTTTNTHLIPNVIITSLPSPPQQEIKDRIYRQNSKRAYSELSKKLGERLKQEQQQLQKHEKDDKETKRHNRKNKEVKVKINNTTK